MDDKDVGQVPQPRVVQLDALLAVVSIGQVPPLALRAQRGEAWWSRGGQGRWRGGPGQALRGLLSRSPRGSAPRRRDNKPGLALKKPLRKSCSAKKRTCQEGKPGKGRDSMGVQHYSKM